MELTCPHCKEKSDSPFIKIENKDIFWCNFCGEESIFFNKGTKIRKLTKKEKDKLYNDDDDKRLDSPLWLPNVNKKDITFEIMTLENGIYNPVYLNYNFSECERYLKLLFHKIGYMPQLGDEVFGYKHGGKKGDEDRFIVVSRAFAVNDYHEMILSVVPEDRWLEKSGW